MNWLKLPSKQEYQDLQDSYAELAVSWNQVVEEKYELQQRNSELAKQLLAERAKNVQLMKHFLDILQEMDKDEEFAKYTPGE